MKKKAKKKAPGKNARKASGHRANQVKKKKDAKRKAKKSGPVSVKSPAPVTPGKPSGLKAPSGLGEAVDKEIAKSPLFKAKLEAVQKKGFVIKYRDDGKPGSACDKNSKPPAILMDPKANNSVETTLSTLAHELGHADYTADPYVPLVPKQCKNAANGAVQSCSEQPFTLTAEEYAEKNAERLLKDEGEATLTAVELLSDLSANGGPKNLKVPGAKAADYAKIAGDSRKSRDAKRLEIGKVFADHERPSTDPKKTYREYYKQPYLDHYSKSVTKPPSGSKPVPYSTLFPNGRSRTSVAARIGQDEERRSNEVSLGSRGRNGRR
jgi:hypothetical protein